MATRPAIQFYPKDWLSNNKLRAATYADRGLWMDVLCVLHDSDEYGLVRWDLRQLATRLGCHLNQLRSLIEKGILKGASDGERSEPVIYVAQKGVTHTVLDPQDGPVWFSSRMLIDEWRLARNRENGALGGNPVLKGEVNPDAQKGVNPIPSSSASSAALIPPKPPKGGVGGEGARRRRGESKAEKAARIHEERKAAIAAAG